MSWVLTMSSSRCMGPGAGCTSLEPPVYKCRERIWAGVPSAHTWPGPSFGGEHRPFEWGWRAVGLCSPCLRWWGRLCRRQCAAGGCARAVLVWEGVSRGYTISIIISMYNKPLALTLMEAQAEGGGDMWDYSHSRGDRGKARPQYSL